MMRIAAFMLVLPLLVSAQTGSQVIGEVTALNAGQISVKTDGGDTLTVIVSATTAFRKVPPGAQSLASATHIDISGVGVGDRVIAIGQKPDDPKKFDARTVVVMSRSDLDQKRQAEQEDWRKRGIAGSVSAVDSGSKTFTVKSGTKSLMIQSGAKTQYRRYSPDSVKFSDALPSSLAEIKPGDQVRVLGDKNADGTAIAAEQVVSGSFRQLAATISSLKPESGEIVVKDLATKKNLTVKVNADSVMRRVPAPMAAQLARASGEQGQMLDRLPPMPLADLKPGDAIMISGAAGPDASRITAVFVLAGVEPLLAASPTATRDIMSGWNLGGGEGGQ